MQPKLKGDTFFIPMPDGVYFRNNQGSFKIKGDFVYPWIESLAPYLNGDHTLEEITAGLGSEKQAMVTDLVNTLLTHGLLKDISQDLPHHLSPLVCETYAAEIAFIDSYCNSAAARFERFREHQVLLIGSGLTMTGLVHASLKSGLRQVATIVTPECETDTRHHHDFLDRFHQNDPRQTLREIAAPLWENEAVVLSTLQPFDTILHISDRPMLARARMLNRLCVTQNKRLIQALLVDDHAWIGPLVRPEQESCWECAWLRLQGNLTSMQEQLPASDFQDHTTCGASPQATSVSRFLALPTATLVANLLSFEVFKYLTGAGPVEVRENLIETNLETLFTQKHPILPHPLCQTCHHPTPPTAAQFLETIEQLEQGEPLDPDLFSKRVAPGFEKRLGLFSSLDEGDIIQLPLSVCKAVVSNPMLVPHLDNQRAVLGFAPTFGAARHRGALRACEWYAASLVDRRLLPSSRTQEAQMIPAERFLNPISLPLVKEWTWAIDLHTGQVCLVPAPLVYPILREKDEQPTLESRLGVSAGMSWAEAVSRALLNVCQYLTIMQIKNAQQPYPQVDLAAVSLEPEGARQRYILEQIYEEATVYDVTGPLRVPTFAICVRGKTFAYGTHLDVAQALRDGFEQAVLYGQLSDEGKGNLSLISPVPHLSSSLRGNLPVGTGLDPVHVGDPVRAHDVPQEWSERKRWLQETLELHGWHAFAVPLNHDPALNQIQPYIVRVLIAHA